MQIEQLFDFLHRSVSPFHAVHTAAQLLDAAGYTRLEEAEYWNLEPEHGYYVTRNESSIIAWPRHWRLAHCCQPFRLPHLAHQEHQRERCGLHQAERGRLRRNDYVHLAGPSALRRRACAGAG